MRGRELLAALFPLFAALLVWPPITVANRPGMVAGIPVLLVYLFGVWAAIVAVLFWASRRADREPPPP